VRAAAVPYRYRYRYRYRASVATVPWAASEGESMPACKMGAVMWNNSGWCSGAGGAGAGCQMSNVECGM